MSRWDFRSKDSEEVQSFLGGVYAENEFKILGRTGPSRTRIYGADVGEIAQYNVSYSSPFAFLSETDRESFLILTCTAGAANFRRGGDLIEFRAGRTAPISASRESRVQSGESLAHISTQISSAAVNSSCAKLLGRPVEEPVLFAHVPFGEELKAHWDLVIRSLSRLLDDEQPSDVAIDSLKEYAITLLLEKHPHNYSRYLERRVSANERVVSDAKRFMEQNADRAISVADVAAFAGCSVRALHNGFCEHIGLTPRACLYAARMTLAQSRLAGEGLQSSPADLARACGFEDFADFESAYRNYRGESPTGDLQHYYRSSRREVDYGLPKACGSLTPAKIDLLRHQINASLGEPITVRRLSALVGMSPQSFAASFKKAFKTSPAQFVLWERLKWARWLLSNTDATISAVAAETGFSSQSHLTSALRLRTGETPFELRKSSRR